MVDALPEPGVNHIECSDLERVGGQSHSYALGNLRSPLSIMRQDSIAVSRGVGRWCKRAQSVLCKRKTVPTAMRVAVICFAVPAVFSVVNLVYQTLHKPMEVFAPIPSEFNKPPFETWRQYAALFREYSTVSIPPELLAALAQVESAGNPGVTTYWRWRLAQDPFAVYQPASSAVGMYQMTDAAFAEAQGYCILNHTVVKDGCSSAVLYSRFVPRHATELTAVFLDRNITAILGHRRNRKISRQQREELAAITHLCGAGPAKAFVRRGFRLLPGERCGDHDVAAYLAQVNAMKRQFLDLAAGT